MPPPRLALLFAGVALTLSTLACSTYAQNSTKSEDNPWPKVTTPTHGDADPIGDYSAGCLRGAVQLPEFSSDYQTMRPQRNRRWGHPALVAFITALARDVRDAGMGNILIGDMGMARGGPTLSGHASHQTGLDVDIWFWQAHRQLSENERETLNAPRRVIRDFEGLAKSWNPQVIDTLKMAGASPSTQRIFVDPVIKKEACRLHKGEAWLAKLRPWWAHDDHFHVRLACPKGSSHCEIQEPVPAGDGCDKTLDDWFTADSRAKARELREHPTPSKMPKLPTLCESVLKEPLKTND